MPSTACTRKHLKARTKGFRKMLMINVTCKILITYSVYFLTIRDFSSWWIDHGKNVSTRSVLLSSTSRTGFLATVGCFYCLFVSLRSKQQEFQCWKEWKTVWHYATVHRSSQRWNFCCPNWQKTNSTNSQRLGRMRPVWHHLYSGTHAICRSFVLLAYLSVYSFSNHNFYTIHHYS